MWAPAMARATEGTSKEFSRSVLVERQLAKEQDSQGSILCVGFTKAEDSVLGFLHLQLRPEKRQAK